jgi:hypothetical protein
MSKSGGKRLAKSALRAGFKWRHRAKHRRLRKQPFPWAGHAKGDVQLIRCCS